MVMCGLSYNKEGYLLLRQSKPSGGGNNESERAQCTFPEDWLFFT